MTYLVDAACKAWLDASPDRRVASLHDPQFHLDFAVLHRCLAVADAAMAATDIAVSTRDYVIDTVLAGPPSEQNPGFVVDEAVYRRCVALAGEAMRAIGTAGETRDFVVETLMSGPPAETEALNRMADHAIAVEAMRTAPVRDWLVVPAPRLRDLP